MVGTAVRDAVTALHDALADCDIEALSLPELLALGDELQTLSCQLPAQSHRILAGLQSEHSPRALGAKSWNEVLRTRWRISTAEASRRLAEAAALGPRRTLIGQPLAPLLPATAAAQAHGLINGEHVEVIRKAMDKVPCFVDAATRTQFEVDLVRLATGVGPKELTDARDGGCTKPCCTVGAYGTQVHHARQDWAEGGNTNVDDLTLACGANNRMVGPDGWTTKVNDHHDVEWIPPPHLDTGQARINYYHRPEKLLHPPEHQNTARTRKPGGPAPPLEDPWGDDDTTETTPPDNHAA